MNMNWLEESHLKLDWLLSAVDILLLLCNNELTIMLLILFDDVYGAPLINFTSFSSTRETFLLIPLSCGGVTMLPILTSL